MLPVALLDVINVNVATGFVQVLDADGPRPGSMGEESYAALLELFAYFLERLINAFYAGRLLTLDE
jgi:hypothetical protein